MWGNNFRGEVLRIQLRGSAALVLCLIMLPCKGAAQLSEERMRILKRNFCTEVGSDCHLDHWMTSRGWPEDEHLVWAEQFGIQILALSSQRLLLGSSCMRCYILGFVFLLLAGKL